MTWLSDILRLGRRGEALWTYSPGAKVWRMLPTDEGALVGEARDEAARTVSFFALDLEDGRVLWEGRTVREAWWVGIETVINDTVLLHMFARPDMPETAGIVALDMGTGKQLWNEPGWRILSARGGEIVVSDPSRDDGRVNVLSARTGEALRVLENGDPDLTVREGTVSEPAGVQYPAQFSEGTAEWSAVLAHVGDRQLAGFVEAVEVDGRRIFSYHSSVPSGTDARTLEHSIIVLDGRGRRVFQDTLHQEAHMPVYDAFFVRNRKAYYVRRESELVCIPVSPDESTQ